MLFMNIRFLTCFNPVRCLSAAHCLTLSTLFYRNYFLRYGAFIPPAGGAFFANIILVVLATAFWYSWAVPAGAVAVMLTSWSGEGRGERLLGTSGLAPISPESASDTTDSGIL